MGALKTKPAVSDDVREGAKRQYHIRQSTDADQMAVEDIFKTTALRFGLVDAKLGSLLQHTVCNYSERLGWGFGLGALRIDDLICVGLNPAKATTDRFRPVFDFIAGELTAAFGERLVLATEAQEIDVSVLPRVKATEAHRAFAQKLLDSNRTDNHKG
jgi:hypothetical protein